jgi:hypothetical protein
MREDVQEHPVPVTETPQRGETVRAVFHDISRGRAVGYGTFGLAAAPLLLTILLPRGPDRNAFVAATAAAALAGAVALWRWGRRRFVAEVTPCRDGMELVIATNDGRGRSDPRVVPWEMLSHPVVRRRRMGGGATVYLTWPHEGGYVSLRRDGDAAEVEALAALLQARIDAAVPQRAVVRAAREAPSVVMTALGLVLLGFPVAAVVQGGWGWSALFLAGIVAPAAHGLYVQLRGWHRVWSERRHAAAAVPLPDGSEPPLLPRDERP